MAPNKPRIQLVAQPQFNHPNWISGSLSLRFVTRYGMCP